MQERTQKGLGSKAKLGRWLLWLGSLVFLGESWLLIARAVEFWQGSGAATLGWVAALGATVQKVLSLLVWNQGLLLAAMAKVLVLCCPLLVIAVGIGMMRQANLIEANESSVDSSAAKEERR
jgi:hypothetical protein